MVKQPINNFACNIGNEVFKMEIRTIRYSCKDCGFYNDCPMEYKCPALECLLTVLEAINEEEDD